MYKGSRVLAPTALFLVVWALVVYLYQLHLVSFYHEMNMETLVFLIFIGLDFVFSRAIAKKNTSTYIPSVHIPNESNDSSLYNRISLKTSKIAKWLVAGIIVSIIYERGVPLLWLFTGDSRSYVEFGIPSVNGLLNSLFYICLVSYFYLYLHTKEKKHLKYVLLLFGYAILIVSRGLLIAGLLEVVGLYLFHFKVKGKHALVLGSVFLGMILLFGLIGDSRNGSDFSQEDAVRAVVDSKYEDRMTSMPSGFTWVYLYSTASINNVVYNFNTLQPTYYPNYTAKRLLPSVISNAIFGVKEYEERYSLEMDNTMINTFTIFSNYLKDYGKVFTVILFFFISLLFNTIFFKAKQGKVNHILMYPAVFMVICLSIFDDFFLSLPTLFQLLITYYSYRGIKI